MAKIPFSKLGVKLNLHTTTININGYDIEVRAYLPMEDKAAIVSNVINAAADNNGYYNPLKIKVFLTLETVYNYTNLSFTAKAKEDPLKLYDIILSSGLFGAIVNAIPDDEWKDLHNTVWHTISNVYEYKNSVAGVIDVVANDYKATNFDLSEVQQKLSDPNEMAFLKELLPLLNAPLA